MNAGDEALEAKDFERAMREYGRAMELNPDNPEMAYWLAVGLANVGRVEESLPHFRRAFAAGERWRTLTPRLPEAGLLPKDDALMRRILEEGK
jgi:tetratricopeptide (TPR) repeat protein